MKNSTRKSVATKPAKPSKDFPLFSHQNGQWAKKVRGKLHYFGLWDDPNAALLRWLDEKDYLLAGLTPRTQTDGLTLKELADRFLTLKVDLVNTGELSPQTYRYYYVVCQRVADVLGKDRPVVDLAAEDFRQLRNSFAETHGPALLSRDIVVSRMLFKYGHDSGLLDTAVRFGPSFKTPSKTARKRARQANGRKDFSMDELRAILDICKQPMKAMVLLGINCGFGNSDIGNLPQSAIDLANGWTDYPRPKTAVERRCPLWPETVKAIQEAIENRPQPKNPDDEECVFITRWGHRFVRLTQHADPSKRFILDDMRYVFATLLKSLNLVNGRRGFYGLRHTFETVGGESCDQVAVNHIMGHSDNSMAATYRHHISDERLKAVTDTVHCWLWPPEEETSAAGSETSAVES